MSKTYNLNDYFTYDFGDYRSGSVGFTIPELSIGQHKLLFRAWDVLNNSSTSELSFNVARNVGEGEISVICTKNPATTTTSFIITHDRSNSEVDLTIDLYDMSGRQLWNTVRTAVPTEGTVTVDWDLKIGGGCRMRTGVYIYRIQLSGNGGTNASCANKLIILGNN